MTLPTLSPPTPVTIPLAPLTPTAFAHFGTVVTSPLPARTSSTTQEQERVPASIPPPLHPTQPTPIFANQNTALKTSPISPLVNEYPSADISKTRPESKPLMSLFTCFPRPSSTLRSNTSKLRLKLTVLERHPYTTQTFTPLGLSPTSPDTVFIVVVAPSLASPTPYRPIPTSPSQASTANDNSVQRPPDLSNIHAFLARGNQAVTYGVGTWHAPMIVLGRSRVDFVVTQFVNGTGDDCEEVAVERVDVSLDDLPKGIVGGSGEERDGSSDGKEVLGKWEQLEKRSRL